MSCQEIHFTTNAEAVVSQITIGNHASLLYVLFIDLQIKTYLASMSYAISLLIYPQLILIYLFG